MSKFVVYVTSHNQLLWHSAALVCDCSMAVPQRTCLSVSVLLLHFLSDRTLKLQNVAPTWNWNVRCYSDLQCTEFHFGNWKWEDTQRSRQWWSHEKRFSALRRTVSWKPLLHTYIYCEMQKHVTAVQSLCSWTSKFGISTFCDHPY